MKRPLLKTILLFLLSWNNSFSQEANEKTLFSFKTKSNKSMVLSLDTVKNEMIYRFGNETTTELEIKDNLNDTIPVFHYSYYFRGGGIANAGLDLNYVTFVNAGYEYKIYYEYSAEGNDSSVGIRVKNLSDNKTVDIKGQYKSVDGSLVAPFRWDNLIPIVDME